MIEWLSAHWETLVILGGQLLATAAIVVKLTPTTTDDEWLAKFTEIFTKFTSKPKA